MKFSIKKKLSVLLSLSSFLSSMPTKSLDVNASDAESVKCIDLEESDAEKLQVQLAILQAKMRSRKMWSNGIRGCETLAGVFVGWKVGQVIGSYAPEVHRASGEKQALLTDQSDGVGQKDAAVNWSEKNLASWLNICNYYDSVSGKKFAGPCGSERELAYALTRSKDDAFFRIVKSPWAPQGLEGPIFARYRGNVQNPDQLPIDDEKLVDISEKLRTYVRTRLEDFYTSLKKPAGEGDETSILDALGRVLDALASKNFSAMSTEWNAVLTLIVELLPVLHLFYSISGGFKSMVLKEALGFAPRVPIIRTNGKGNEVLTTSDCLKSWGDCKGTVEINLATNKVEELIGMNSFKLFNMLLNWEKAPKLASTLYSLFDAKKGNVYSSLFENLKKVIALVHELLKKQKESISELFQIVNNKMLPEINKQENYITSLFRLKTGLKETLLDENDINQAMNEAKINKGSDLTTEEKEEVIKKMQIKKINRALLTDKIKKQLPDLPVFREIGEFFIEKFFDELGFVYE